MLDKFFSLRCPDCGEKFSEEDDFCPSCGVYLGERPDFDDRKILAEELFDKAMALCNSGRSLEHALEKIDLAVEFDPEYSEAHNLRGIILDLMNKKQAAISAYKEAIRLDPHNSDAIENLQELVGSNYRNVISDLWETEHEEFLEGKDKETAAFAYYEALRFDPNYLDALESLQEIRGEESAEEKQAVILAYQEAIRENPQYLDEIESLPEIGYEEPERKVISPKIYSSQENWDGISFGRVVWWGIVLLAVLWGIYYAYQEFGRDLILPKQTIVFQPDYAQVDDVTSEDLESVAQTLNDRAKVLGYASITFYVENEQIIGKVPNSFNADAFAENISPMGLLEFVDFGENPMASGSNVNTDLNSLEEDSGAWHTVMTNEYIEEAMMTQDQLGNYQVAFSLTSEGTEVFAKHTSENIGSYLCIVLDKEVISCPRIQAAITGGQGVVSGQFTYESAETLTMILNTAALPFPVEYIGDVDAVE